MRSLPDISAAEWDVMKIVWSHGPMTSGQVVRRLAAQRRWKPRTIKTLLARLAKKQAVSMTSEDGRFLYRAKVARELLVRREARSFLARVFDGAIAPALLHLVKEVDLSPEQIDELKRILDGEARR